MPKYKVSVVWQGNNEKGVVFVATIDEFDNETEARDYGFDSLADGCGEVVVKVELIEEEVE